MHDPVLQETRTPPLETAAKLRPEAQELLPLPGERAGVRGNLHRSNLITRTRQYYA